MINVDLALLESDTKAARGARPYVMANLSRGQGIDQILAFFVGRGRFNFNLNQRFPLCAFLRRGSIRGDLGARCIRSYVLETAIVLAPCL